MSQGKGEMSYGEDRYRVKGSWVWMCVCVGVLTECVRVCVRLCVCSMTCLCFLGCRRRPGPLYVYLVAGLSGTCTLVVLLLEVVGLGGRRRRGNGAPAAPLAASVTLGLAVLLPRV